MRSAQVDRFERALVNRAFNSLGQAESAWQRFVPVFESLASQHSNTAAGVMAREIAAKLHDCREVLMAWTEV